MVSSIVLRRRQKVGYGHLNAFAFTKNYDRAFGLITESSTLLMHEAGVEREASF